MQVVHIDNDAVAAMCGLRARQTYLDVAKEEGEPDGFGDETRQTLVTREGSDVRVLVCDHGCIQDYFPAEARRLGAAIMKASEDAAEFLKASTVWSKAQRKDFKGEFKGELAKAVYRFAEPGRTYTVEMGGCEINGKRQRLSVISIDGVEKADMYSEDLDLSHDAAAKVLKSFLVKQTIETDVQADLAAGKTEKPTHEDAETKSE